MLNSVTVVFKTFFICTLNASKVNFVTFNFNCRLHTVSVGKPSARMSNFWTVRIFYSRIRSKFWFSTHPCSQNNKSRDEVKILIVMMYKSSRETVRQIWCRYWHNDEKHITVQLLYQTKPRQLLSFYQLSKTRLLRLFTYTNCNNNLKTICCHQRISLKKLASEKWQSTQQILLLL